VFRPPRSNAARILQERAGIELRKEVRIAHIAVRGGRVSGVVLASGEAIATPVVVSGLDPAHTLTELLDPGWLDPGCVRALCSIRARGVVARATLTLDREPGFATLVIAPSLDYLERAADDAKYGRISQAPYLEARSAGAAADGRHRVQVHVQYAPYALADGAWDETSRAALARAVVARLAPHAPALAAAVVEVSVTSPLDLEREYGYPEGQAHHAELTLDQALWMRPVPGSAHYRMPVAGLYLAGPGTHPGAGIIGASGAHAARAVMRDLRRGSVQRGNGGDGC
jgi:phytoene dehydrogenase-like protein